MRKRLMGSKLTMRKCNGMRVDMEKRSDWVRDDHEKKSDGLRVDHKKKSNG